ncbi:MAG: amylo-alpha-1,6-glucosidase [Desulfatibacillaceae bacterium]
MADTGDSSRDEGGQGASLAKRGYDRAVDLLRKCSTSHGFLASPIQKANYRRVWGRDGSICVLAALMTGDEELMDTARKTLGTLGRYQGPHGEIPSNVDPESGRISYGGMAGRVDADLWFVIACGEYWQATGDDEFIQLMIPPVEKTLHLLGAWEFNNRGLLYIPQTGDWADEYLQNGYVLYDQLLYYQVQRTVCAIRHDIQDSEDHALVERKSRLKDLIRDNYWFFDDGHVPDHVYHEILYKKGRKCSERHAEQFWLPFFSPHGYGYRFDSFANVLASLLEVADDDRRECVDRHVDRIMAEKDMALLPAFDPVITPVDDDWEDLQMTFSYSFKNEPHEFHNGGLWPMITGFYVADLARRGQTEKARGFLHGVNTANRMEMEGEKWSFPEFVHGENYTPGGTRHLAWSAAGTIIGAGALEGKEVFRIDGAKK